jgi:hypothetical protein
VIRTGGGVCQCAEITRIAFIPRTRSPTCRKPAASPSPPRADIGEPWAINNVGTRIIVSLYGCARLSRRFAGQKVAAFAGQPLRRRTGLLQNELLTASRRPSLSSARLARNSS